MSSAASTPSLPPPSPEVAAIEAEIGARRDRLASSIDELLERANPKNIVQRKREQAKARFADVATTPEGDLRVERVAAVVAVVAVVGGIVLYRRLRRH